MQQEKGESAIRKERECNRKRERMQQEKGESAIGKEKGQCNRKIERM